MPLWAKAKLTPSKAVELGKGEIVFAAGNAGRFCQGEDFDKPLRGHVTLTTHRIIIVAGDRSTTGCIHLSRVVTVELKWVSLRVGRLVTSHPRFSPLSPTPQTPPDTAASSLPSRISFSRSARGEDAITGQSVSTFPRASRR